MIKPIGKRVVLERIVDEKSDGGIILTPTAQESNKARVVAVAAPKQNEGDVYTPEVEVGCTVLFDTRKTTNIEFENKKYLLISEDDILAILA